VRVHLERPVGGGSDSSRYTVKRRKADVSNRSNFWRARLRVNAPFRDLTQTPIAHSRRRRRSMHPFRIASRGGLFQQLRPSLALPLDRFLAFFDDKVVDNEGRNNSLNERGSR